MEMELKGRGRDDGLFLMYWRSRDYQTPALRWLNESLILRCILVLFLVSRFVVFLFVFLLLFCCVFVFFFVFFFLLFFFSLLFSLFRFFSFFTAFYFYCSWFLLFLIFYLFNLCLFIYLDSQTSIKNNSRNSKHNIKTFSSLNKQTTWTCQHTNITGAS